MAASQLLAATILLGYAGYNAGNASSLALSASATWLAFQFVPDQNETLDNVRLYMVTKTGTPAAADLTCDLYSDSSGIPGSSLESKSATSSPASGNWVSWTGFTTALTAGTAYWLVFKNANGTPASNYPTYQWGGMAIAGVANAGYFSVGNLGMPSVMYGWNKVHTTNSGTAWATGIQSSVAGPRVGYADGTFHGLPCSDISRSGNQTSSDRAYGKQEVGVKFSLPTGVTYKVRGVAMQCQKVSTPGALRFRIYQGTTLLGTTNSIPAANVTTGNSGDIYTAFFSSDISIDPSAGAIRVVMGDATAGDASTVGYQPPLLTIDSDSNSQALKPCNGTMVKTVTADNTAAPVVWTDTSTQIMPCVLLCSTLGELAAAGGGTVIFVED